MNIKIPLKIEGGIVPKGSPLPSDAYASDVVSAARNGDSVEEFVQLDLLRDIKWRVKPRGEVPDAVTIINNYAIEEVLQDEKTGMVSILLIPKESSPFSQTLYNELTGVLRIILNRELDLPNPLLVIRSSDGVLLTPDVFFSADTEGAGSIVVDVSPREYELDVIPLAIEQKEAANRPFSVFVNNVEMEGDFSDKSDRVVTVGGDTLQNVSEKNNSQGPLPLLGAVGSILLSTMAYQDSKDRGSREGISLGRRTYDAVRGRVRKSTATSDFYK